jgi:hypothetical protein
MSGIGNVPRAENNSPARYEFRFGPFSFESEIDIPELRRLSGAADVAVSIRLGGVPEDIPAAASYGRFCRVSASEYLLSIPGVARFYVARGTEVRVELAANAPAADVSTFLLGSVFGALCHQNGLLPLHASAVEGKGSVTAFLGESGAGKSTLAACLQERGYRIVADDICLLAPQGESGAMRVIPVAGWVKLWRASLDHLGRTPDERHRVYSEDDKYRLFLKGEAEMRPVLGNLVFLAKGEGKPGLDPLSTAEAIAQLMRLTYVGYITELTGSHAPAFRQCAQALQGAKAWRMTVPWGFEQMDKVLDLVEAELLGTTRTGAGMGSLRGGE